MSLPSDRLTILNADVLDGLRSLPDGCVQTCVTSPPYWGLRDYGTPGQMGLEATPEEYVERMVGVFREVRRVLRDDGTLFLNLGDSYSTIGGSNASADRQINTGQRAQVDAGAVPDRCRSGVAGYKPKDLLGMPWRVAFALQADGWWLRSDIIWAKPNPMPESVTDRPTRSHEYIFLLTKAERYFYDAEAIKEPLSSASILRLNQSSYDSQTGGPKDYANGTNGSRSAGRALVNLKGRAMPPQVGDSPEQYAALTGRNKRSVWTVPSHRFPDAHFACVDEETEALTHGGWRTHDELRDGEMIAGYDPTTHRIRWMSATFHRYPYDGNMVAIEKRDSSQLLTPNHRCLVRRRSGAKTVVEASELRACMSVPMTAPWDVVPQVHLGCKMAALLGWYITEGHDRAPGRVRIYQSLTANPAHVETIRGLLDSLHADYRFTTRLATWRGRDSHEACFTVAGPIASRLQSLAPSKTMNMGLAMLGVLDAEALLDALVDGDGHRRADGRMCIVQKDQQSIELMQVLALRLGYRAQLSRRADGIFVLYMTRGEWLTLRGTNGTHRRPETAPYRGVVWCPSVVSGFWLARRRGKPFITGNTFPPALIRPCILAGTSERGCCPACGAPWRRVTVRTDEPDASAKGSTFDGGKTGARDGGDRTQAGPRHVRRSTGWVPDCLCDKEPVPCLVLDCFGGAGTTGLVALEYGRRALLIELSADYCDMARRRLAPAAAQGVLL